MNRKLRLALVGMAVVFMASMVPIGGGGPVMAPVLVHAGYQLEESSKTTVEDARRRKKRRCSDRCQKRRIRRANRAVARAADVRERRTEVRERRSSRRSSRKAQRGRAAYIIRTITLKTLAGGTPLDFPISISTN